MFKMLKSIDNSLSMWESMLKELSCFYLDDGRIDCEECGEVQLGKNEKMEKTIKK